VDLETKALFWSFFFHKYKLQALFGFNSTWSFKRKITPKS
jgi:hypothetical protein